MDPNHTRTNDADRGIDDITDYPFPVVAVPSPLRNDIEGRLRKIELAFLDNQQQIDLSELVAITTRAGLTPGERPEDFRECAPEMAARIANEISLAALFPHGHLYLLGKFGHERVVTTEANVEHQRGMRLNGFYGSPIWYAPAKFIGSEAGRLGVAFADVALVDEEGSERDAGLFFDALSRGLAEQGDAHLVLAEAFSTYQLSRTEYAKKFGIRTAIAEQVEIVRDLQFQRLVLGEKFHESDHAARASALFRKGSKLQSELFGREELADETRKRGTAVCEYAAKLSSTIRRLERHLSRGDSEAGEAHLVLLDYVASLERPLLLEDQRWKSSAISVTQTASHCALFGLYRLGIGSFSDFLAETTYLMPQTTPAKRGLALLYNLQRLDFLEEHERVMLVDRQ